jgi:hypothetical protein
VLTSRSLLPVEVMRADKQLESTRGDCRPVTKFRRYPDLAYNPRRRRRKGMLQQGETKLVTP